MRKQEDVDNGEDVQLCSYALLLDAVARVEYLQLDAARAQVKAQLEGAALTELAKSVGDRLLHITDALLDGTAMPAWGDAAHVRVAVWKACAAASPGKRMRRKIGEAEKSKAARRPPWCSPFRACPARYSIPCEFPP